ncbi:MAG: phosphotransferase [Patescibacteria group bacterium]|nr:phosphotransferase [Patescibacteria group bacterium]
MDTELKKLIKKLYGLSIDKSVLIKEGFMGHNRALYCGKEKYFLKRYYFTDEPKIKEVHRVKKFFSSKGIPVILPMQARNHSTYFCFDGRYYALFPFVNGRKLFSEKLTAKALRSSGEMLARIHLISKRRAPFKLADQFSSWNTEQFLKDAEHIITIIQRKKKKSCFDFAALEVLKVKMDFARKNRVAFAGLHLENDHLIHGDYHAKNLFFDNADNVEWVFDFEKTQIAPRIMEMIRSAIIVCFDGRFTKKNFKKAEEYIGAYTKLYPLKKAEVESGLTAFVVKHMHSVWVEKEHYLKHSRRVDRFLESTLKERFFMYENFSRFVKLFMGKNNHA